jgi:tetratricopeptide (TPR) repeat protein
VKSLTGDLAHERFDSPPIASVSARLYLAWCFGDRGRFADALATAQEALAIAEAADHPLSIVNGCLSLGIVHMEKGDIARAIVALERTLSVIRDWDIATFLPLGASAMGAALVMAGRAREAIPLLEQAVATADAGGRIEGQSIRIAALAKAYAFDGKTKRSVELGQRALALARSHWERGREARVLGMLGEIHMKQARRSDQAEACFREGLALAGELGMQPLVVRCHLGLAETMERRGRPAEAKAHRATATQLSRKLGMVAD